MHKATNDNCHMWHTPEFDFKHATCFVQTNKINNIKKVI